MSCHRPRPVESLHLLSEEELLNRVIRAKALLALCGNMTVTIHTAEGILYPIPEAGELFAERVLPVVEEA